MNVKTQTMILIAVAGLIVIGCTTAVIVKACEPTPEEPTASMVCNIVEEKYISSFEYDDDGEKKVQTARDGHSYHVIKVKIVSTGDKQITPTMSWFTYDSTGSIAGGQLLGMQKVMDVIYKYDSTAGQSVTLSKGESTVMTLIYDASSDSINVGTLYTYDGTYEAVR